MKKGNRARKYMYARTHVFTFENVQHFDAHTPTYIHVNSNMIYGSEHTSLAPGISKMDLGLSSEM